VQGDLVAALKNASLRTSDLPLPIFASRTDAGVHAATNLVQYSIPSSAWNELKSDGLARVLAKHFSNDISILNTTATEFTSNPRWMRSRTYRYLLSGHEYWGKGCLSTNIDAFREVSELFIGMHDWSAFAKIERNRDPMREVLRIDPLKYEGVIIGFEIEGTSFLRQMVRRIAGAFYAIEDDYQRAGQITNALSSNTVAPGITAEAEWLTLWRINDPENENLPKHTGNYIDWPNWDLEGPHHLRRRHLAQQLRTKIAHEWRKESLQIR